MTSIGTDRPVGDPKDDEFGRDLFAQALANALVLPPGAPSIVAGIEAEWGTGKTTVLNFVAHHLKQHQPEPIIVRLEGWLLSAGEGTQLRLSIDSMGETFDEVDCSMRHRFLEVIPLVIHAD